MEEKSTSERFGSRTIWESLEEMARKRIQEFVQSLLEEEVTALVGRRKSERREAVDAPVVYRNGRGKPRKLAMMGGTIEVRRPRVRGLEERFESRILPLFRRRTEAVIAGRSGPPRLVRDAGSPRDHGALRAPSRKTRLVVPSKVTATWCLL